MSFVYESGGDLSSGGKYLNEEGSYHFCIVGVEDPVLDKDDKPIANKAFRVQCEVLDGTTEGQKEKSCRIDFNLPLSSHKDGGDFSRKCIDKFMVATAMVDPQSVEKGKKFTLDLQELMARQFIAKMKKETGNNGKEYLQLDGDHVHHVDDPAVAAVPKDAIALGTLDPAWRRIGQKPAEKKPARAASKKAATKPTAQQAAAAAIVEDAIDYDNI